MKTNSRPRYINRYRFFVTIVFTLLYISAHAQLCLNAKDTVYGLTTTGQVSGVNVNNAGSVAIGAAAASATNSNGVGFSQINGLFYFFNQTGGGTTEFVSYNPITSSKVILNGTVPATLTTAQKIRSGAVNKTGSAYYTINPAAAGGPALYYYNIALNTWTTITQTFKDPSAVSLNASLNTLNSGDMAFDGAGNLWILASNATNYALYKIAAPVPIVFTASITATVYIAATTTTPLGASFTGIAFNSAGKLYITTGTAGAAAGQNKLYLLTTPSSASLTLVGSITNSDFGADISSCAFPTNPLPVKWLDFKAQLKDKSVDLSWKVIEDQSTSGYDVESSVDGKHWKTIVHINSDGNNDGTEKIYTYSDFNFAQGNNYYRIKQLDYSGAISFSNTRYLTTDSDNKIYIGPNPTRDLLYVYNKRTGTYYAQIFDRDGRQLSSSVLNAGEQTISVSSLQRGVYVLRLSSALQGTTSETYRFVKQ